MALWLVRTGRHGEHEQHFLTSKRIFLTWRNLNEDLGKLKTKEQFQEMQASTHPAQAPKAVIHYAAQARVFVHEMQINDWVVVPCKTRSTIHFAEIVGDYTFDSKAPEPYKHCRSVKWLVTDVPRSVFDQDLLYSFGAFSTICQIQRNDAENRVKAMAKAGWPAAAVPSPTETPENEDDDELRADLEEVARDRIAAMILAKFKGHGMSRLVDAVLRAQGYTTYVSPAGPDKGIDLLAAPGPLGFGHPRICVQVKSGDGSVDSPTLHQLIGSMQKVQAEQGLLVSWGGFKTSVEKELPTEFFRVRLWDQKVLIEQLLEHYDNLDPDIRAELPLKRIWTIAAQDESD